MKNSARFAAAVAALGFAAGSANAAPNFSGFWTLQHKTNAAAALLTPWGQQQRKKFKADGDVDTEADRWCVFQGMPYVMDSAGAIDIIQAPGELVFLTERHGLPRHIYTDGRKHPDEEVFDHTALGNSIGHWEGDVLVSDTVGLDAGVGPYGAPRTDTSHLVERFRLARDTLVVNATWSDAKALKSPLTYTLTYSRLPKTYAAVESYCDPRNNGVGHP